MSTAPLLKVWRTDFSSILKFFIQAVNAEYRKLRQIKSSELVNLLKRVKRVAQLVAYADLTPARHDKFLIKMMKLVQQAIFVYEKTHHTPFVEELAITLLSSLEQLGKNYRMMLYKKSSQKPLSRS